MLWATHGWKTFSYEVQRRDYSGRFNRRAAEHVHDDLAKKAKEVASLKAELQAKFPEAMKEYEEVIATIMAGKVSFLSIASLFSNFFSCSIIFFLFSIVSFCSAHVSTYQGLRGIPVARFPKRQNDAGMTGRARLGSVGSGSSSGISSNSGAARSWSLLDPSPEEKDRPSSPVVSFLQSS